MRDKSPVATSLEQFFFSFTIFQQMLQLATKKFQNLCNCNWWSGLLQLGSAWFLSFFHPSKLDLQNYPHLASYQNQGDLGNSTSFKTFLCCIPPLTPSLPSTAWLTQVSTPALGVLSQSFASSYGSPPWFTSCSTQCQGSVQVQPQAKTVGTGHCRKQRGAPWQRLPLVQGCSHA